MFSYYLCTILPEPFALYALNETGIVRDISGNSNPNGTAHNAHEADGPFDGEKSIGFKGKSTSYIRIGHNGELSMNASFSILAWIYKNLWHAYESDIASFSSHDKNVSGLVLIANKLVGRLYFPSSGQTVEVANVLSNYHDYGWWHHVALIYNYDTGYASLYTNTHVYKKFVGSYSVDTSGEVIIGKLFDGKIACVQFYRRPLLLEHVEDANDVCYRGSPGM